MKKKYPGQMSYADIKRQMFPTIGKKYAKKKRLHAEDDLQEEVAEYLDIALRSPTLWWHTPNGGNRSWSEAKRFKKMGVKSGVPDVIIIHHGVPYFIELKAPKGKPSPQQITMEMDLRSQGCKYALCRSLDEVIANLETWNIQLSIKAA